MASFEDFASGRAHPPLWWRALTTPAAAAYASAISARNILFDRGAIKSHKLPGTTISVGNIAVGGTGKSPVVIALAQLLLSEGQRPAILTRGYGSTLGAEDSMTLLDGKVILKPRVSASVPDEARMQSNALPTVPVVVGKDRYTSAMGYLTTGAPEPTHWLLDDGFQHRMLARDLDIVLLDAARPFAAGHLLPRGLLREPPSALARAGLVLYTRASADSPSRLDQERVRSLTKAPLVKVEFHSGPLEPVQGAAPWSGSGPVLLATGVADPGGVGRSLTGLGIRIQATYSVRDHSPLDRAELASRVSGAFAIVTTAKDYWRDPDVFRGLPTPVYLLPLTVRLALKDIPFSFLNGVRPL